MDINNYHRDREYQENEKQFKNIFQKRFNQISKFKKIGTILDIGCSNGILLDIFKKNNWETWGVEPSGNAKVAIEKKHKIIISTFETAKLPLGYFDVVVLNHTLEHMNDPSRVIQKIHSLLKNGGILLIDVPNFGGLSSKIMGKRWPLLLPEEHKHQFTKELLSIVVKANKFKIIYIKTSSGLLDYADPCMELFQSLFSLKKRFFSNMFGFPGALIATILNMGSGLTLIAKKQ